jgi:hypothetical protein
MTHPTPDANTLVELAARVEAAPGPDRELDAIITSAAWPYRSEGGRIAPAPSGNGRCVSYYASGNHGTWKAPDYTASLDAAMQLVPEGWEPWDLNKGARWHFSLNKQGGKYPIVDGHADTWALAICAAALRARAAAESAK